MSRGGATALQRPSDAAKVNAYAPLLARAKACERIRKRLIEKLNASNG